MARKLQRLDPQEQYKRRRRLLWAVLSGSVGLILAAGGVLYLRLTNGPALPRSVQKRWQEMARPASPPASFPQATPGSPMPSPVAALPATPPPLREQWQQFKQAALRGDMRPQKLYITEAELNAQLAAQVAASAELKEAHIFLERGSAYAVARVHYKGRDWTITLAVQPQIVAGSVRFVIAEAYVGKIAAPAAARELLQQEIAKRGEWLKPSQTGIYVESLELQPELAILTGRPYIRR